MMRAGLYVCSIAILGLGCSESHDPPGSTDGSTGTETDTQDAGSTSASTSAGSTSSGSTTTGTSDATESSTTAEEPTTGETSSETDSDTESEDQIGCPDDAPASWLLCESFEGITDPSSEISQWGSQGGAFAVEPGPSVSGEQSLRVRLVPGQQFGGWVTLRFGDGPTAPATQSPDARVDEVWARYWLRTQDGWPGRHIGDIGELLVLNASNWAIASDLNIQGLPDLRLRPYGWRCIDDSGTLLCNGQNDWAGTLQSFWNGTSEDEFFDAGHAGQWLCIEAHMRLNDPGQSNGAAEVYIDGELQVSGSNLNWRGTWDAYGINGVRFTAYATPPQDPLDFHIDDVVVATERVGCEILGG
jgi:hypothetical protein